MSGPGETRGGSADPPENQICCQQHARGAQTAKETPSNVFSAPMERGINSLFTRGFDVLFSVEIRGYLFFDFIKYTFFFRIIFCFVIGYGCWLSAPAHVMYVYSSSAPAPPIVPHISMYHPLVRMAVKTAFQSTHHHHSAEKLLSTHIYLRKKTPKKYRLQSEKLCCDMVSGQVGGHGRSYN